MTERDDQVAAIRASFDERAPSYDDSAMHRGLARSVARFARVAGDGAVLDAATGTGLVARALAARHPGLEITGVDVSGGMLAVARAALPAATWIEADATVLPLPGASIDLVTCVTALHLFSDPDAAIAEWARVLRPGGCVVTATFASAGHTAHAGHEHGHTAHTAPGHEHGHTQPSTPRRNHEPFASLDRLAQRLAPVGLRIERAMTWVRTDDRVLVAEARLAG